MGFEIFKKEDKIITEGHALLDRGGFADEESVGQFAALLKDYEKLFKSTKRLVRLSDRNEAELNATAKTLDEKSNMLEELSRKLSKYLSPQVYKSIFSGEQEATLETSRKKLTVFFSDIKDFTETTEDLQAEDLTNLLNQYFTVMSTIALEYGATIDKFIGDAMLMFFGDPESKGVKEDARACVAMAVAMQRKMRDLQEVWRDKGYEKPFQMRVGINTGFCNVGNFGSDVRMDYTIIGGEVNLAARLESSAEPGGILMSYETYALVKDMIAAEEKPPIKVKGIRRKVRPYAVTGILDDIEQEKQFIRHESDGMLLVMDLNKLTGESRLQALAEIEKMAERLRE